MKKKKTRSIKYVKRYNARALISSLLLLLSSAGIVAAFLFLPLFKFDIGETETYNIFAMDFIMDASSKILGGPAPELSEAYLKFNSLFVTPIIGGIWAPLGEYLAYIVAGLLALAAIFIVIGFLGGLLCTAVGYIAGGYKAPKIMCALNFWFVLFVALMPVACHTALQIKGNPDGMYIWSSYGLFFPACLFIVWLIVKLIYTFGLKDRIFKKKLDKIVAIRNEELSHRRSFGAINSDGSVVLNPNDKKQEPKPYVLDEKYKLDFSDSDDFEHFCNVYGESNREPVVEIPSYVKKEEKIKKAYEPTPFKVMSQEQIELEEKAKQQEEQEKETVVSYKKDNGLPEGLTYLEDHQFSKNVDLTVANIPDGISEIAPSCFANCINLKYVRIPRSIKAIKFNAFFGCVNLTTINFEGTRSEWRAINRGSNWLTGAATDIIVCSDGSLKVNPLH